jgi:predicted porin
VRLTLRPWRNVTLVSRYEYQLSTVHTKPDAVSGLGETESSELNSHIIAQNATWTPWSRLSLQAGFNYVLSTTHTPASDYTQAVLDAQNNYWTLNFNSTLVLDDKTDLNLGYFYYRADDYQDNSVIGVPLGAGAEEHGATAMISRRLTPHVRANLKYGYFRYTDQLSGGHDDSEAHLIYASMQYRF